MAKVVLAYSGGLDTTVCVKWLQERYQLDVVTLTVDVGQDKDAEAAKEKALLAGAVAAHVIDAREEFVTDYCWPALRAHAVYEYKYPLSAALSRPLISRKLVEVARAEGATAVAHGCTGKGNDQVRFEVSVGALAPDLKVIAPVREWPMSREDEIAYAQAHGLPVSITQASPYSLDQNLWGRSIECGVLEDPWEEAPEDAFLWTVPTSQWPHQPRYLNIAWERGVPVALEGRRLGGARLVDELNLLGGAYGVGRVDHVENRLVGIKSREIYECPAATILLEAHQALEALTLDRSVAQCKAELAPKYAALAYQGLWFSPLRASLDAFVDHTQEHVSGEVRVKLQGGSCQVVGRRSPHSLYDYGLATYDRSDEFQHDAAAGFISLWGLPVRVHAAKRRSQSAQLRLVGEST